jgi:hypothetical protein
MKIELRNGFRAKSNMTIQRQKKQKNPKTRKPDDAQIPWKEEKRSERFIDELLEICFF